MKDRFLSTEKTIERLVYEYNKHETLYVGFDFDNTVYDYQKRGDTYPLLENLLRYLKEKKFKLVLFTGNEGANLEYAVEYCTARGFAPDYVNESPLMPPEYRKPMMNILLDDRCGLHEAYIIMKSTLRKCGFDYDDTIEQGEYK